MFNEFFVTLLTVLSFTFIVGTSLSFESTTFKINNFSSGDDSSLRLPLGETYLLDEDS